jgi:hypothetical protein
LANLTKDTVFCSIILFFRKTEFCFFLAILKKGRHTNPFLIITKLDTSIHLATVLVNFGYVIIFINDKSVYRKQNKYKPVCEKVLRRLSNTSKCYKASIYFHYFSFHFYFNAGGVSMVLQSQIHEIFPTCLCHSYLK